MFCKWRFKSNIVYNMTAVLMLHGEESLNYKHDIHRPPVHLNNSPTQGWSRCAHPVALYIEKGESVYTLQGWERGRVRWGVGEKVRLSTWSDLHLLPTWRYRILCNETATTIAQLNLKTCLVPSFAFILRIRWRVI